MGFFLAQADELSRPCTAAQAGAAWPRTFHCVIGPISSEHVTMSRLAKVRARMTLRRLHLTVEGELGIVLSLIFARGLERGD